jgi:hypothetical protein
MSVWRNISPEDRILVTDGVNPVGVIKVDAGDIITLRDVDDYIIASQGGVGAFELVDLDAVKAPRKRGA